MTWTTTSHFEGSSDLLDAMRPSLTVARRTAMSHRSQRRAALGALLCGIPALRPALAAERRLLIAVAASLAPTLRELAAAFEELDPTVRVAITTGASGSLLQQLAAGAPIDVLVSADEATMQRARAQSLLREDSQRVLVTNTLVVVQPARGASAPIASLADLAGPGIKRIALGAPASVPAGAYARGALEAAGLWQAVLPRAVYAQNVRQVLDFVARGEADAGFVYATDVPMGGAATAAVRTAIAAVPTTPPIRCPVAISAASAQPLLAERFVASLFQPAARALFSRHGFGRP